MSEQQDFAVIDLSDSLAAQAILDAAVSSGFFFVSNHGFKQDEVESIFNISNEFFTQDVTHKEPYAIQPDNLGWSSIGREALDGDLAAGDAKEFAFQS